MNDLRPAWRVFSLAATAVFLVSLDSTVAFAAFPVWRAAFPETSAESISWILNGYAIVYAALLVPAGRWADQRGRRRVFLEGLLAFGVASAVCGWVSSPLALTAARAFQAVGAAMLTPASLGLVLAAFPLSRRAEVVSLWGAIGALAAAIGPAAGSWLMEVAGWRSIFWINVPVVAWAWWRSHRALPPEDWDPPSSPARIDEVGTLGLIAAVGLVVFGLVRMQPGWAVGGIALLVMVLTWIGRRGEAGAMDLRLFRDRDFALSTAAMVVFAVVFSMMFMNFFLFMTGVWGYSQSLAGLAATPGPLMVVPFAVLAGKWATKRGHRGVLVAGGLLFAVGQVWMWVRVGEQPDYLAAWLPGQLLSGAAIGLVLPSLIGAAVAGLKGGALAEGNAVVATARQLGGALGVAVAIVLVGQAGAGLAAHRAVFVVIAAGGLATAALCWGLHRPATGR